MTALVYAEVLAIFTVVLAIGGAIVENTATGRRFADRLGRLLFG